MGVDRRGLHVRGCHMELGEARLDTQSQYVYAYKCVGNDDLFGPTQGFLHYC